MNEKDERPKPGDFKEIARGSGPAAILLFLHIAASGYLGFVAWFLLKNNSEVFWNLLPFSAALYFYFPTAFAILTPMATDKLTRIVGTVARIMGVVTAFVYAGGLVQQGMSGDEMPMAQWAVTASAVAAGLVGALLCRVVFAMGIRGGDGFFRKNDKSNGTP